MARKVKSKNPNRISYCFTTPYGYACKFCGQGGTARMESVLTKRKEHIWFHKDCFEKYVKECNN